MGASSELHQTGRKLPRRGANEDMAAARSAEFVQKVATQSQGRWRGWRL